MFWFMLLFCGLTVAQDALQGASGTKSLCNTDTCDLLKRVEALENQLIESKKCQENRVIFSVAVDANGIIGPFSTEKTVIYNSVLTNVGSGYNSNTGIFSAPVAGVYYFTFFYHSGGEHQTLLSLMKNSETLVLASDDTSTYYGADNGGNALFLQLQQNDQVFVRMRVYSHIWAVSRMTSFSGFLVSGC